MEPTAATTRREQEHIAIITGIAQPLADPVEQTTNLEFHDKRAASDTVLTDLMMDVAAQLSAGVDPTSENITVREFKYLTQLNTALFCLNVINGGLPLDKMCTFLQDPTTRMRLTDIYINPTQASDVICFASVYGIYLGQSNEQLLAALADLEYTIQLHAYGNDGLQQACESLRYSGAEILGVDVKGIQQYICNGTAGIPESTNLPDTTTGTNSSPAQSTVPFVGTGVGSGTAPVNNPLPMPTSSENSIIFGTNGPTLSSATSAAGTVSPWFNTSTTDVATSSSASITERGQVGNPLTAGGSFYLPPRLARERLRRHGGGVL